MQHENVSKTKLYLKIASLKWSACKISACGEQDALKDILAAQNFLVPAQKHFFLAVCEYHHLSGAPRELMMLT